MNTINKEDQALFRSTVEGNAPIDKDAAQHTKKNNQQNAFTAYSYITEANLTGSDIVFQAQSGVSPKILKKMKQGNIGGVVALDLHGQTVIEACESMSAFMHEHQHEQFVHIIHGKGYHSENSMSVLKTQVVSFLNQHPQVMAITSCPEKDGGTGAVFALLKQI